MAVYFVVSVTYSWTRALELQTSTWDMGIYQQALWSSYHGRTFYEAADLETGGFGTFLQVHSVYLLYLLVPVYSAWPFQWTLFAVQSGVVAVAAYPLFLLGQDVSGSPRIGLAAGLMYLAWAPTLASNLYDFHVEAFLPLEVFAFILLWNRGRYAWGLLVALVAFLTMELTPVLLFFVGLFFVWPGAAAVRVALRNLRDTSGVSAWIRRGVGWFAGSPRRIASVGLMALCFVVYYLNLLLREKYLALWFGAPPFPSSNSGYVIGGTFTELGLSPGNLAVGFTTKLFSWILLLLLLGLVPLLAPRALVLAVPWVGFSFLSTNTNFVTLGFQYGFIEAAALLVAFVYGLAELARLGPRLLGSGQPPVEDPGSGRSPGARARASYTGTRRRWVSAGSMIALVVLLSVNIAASPINPHLTRADGLGSAYGVSPAIPKGFAAVQALAALIPPAAPVLASDFLFPLVANNLNAYSLFWMQNSHLILPFNATRLPDYVFLSEDQTFAVPSWLTGVLYNQSDYGIRGIAWSTPAGAVVLFEGGFHGAAVAFDTPAPTFQRFTGAALDPQTGGTLVASGDPQFPRVVESLPVASGPIWSAPYANLPPGNYTITLGLEAHPTNPAQPPSPMTPAVFVNSNAFAQPVWFQASYSYASLQGSTWVAVSFPVSVVRPSLEVEVRGYLSDPSVTVEIAYLDIAPVP